MKIYLKNVLLISFLLLSLNVYATKENLFSGIKGTELTSSNKKIIVVDNWYEEYINEEEDDYFSLVKSEVFVRLWFDDALQNFYSTGWDLGITFDLELTKKDGSIVNLNSVGLNINYTTTGTYTDIRYKVFNNANYIKAVLSNVSITTNTFSTPIPNDIHLDVELRTEKYYLLENEITTPVYSTAHVLTDGQLELSWPYVEGAESYDVEWLFIDEPQEDLSTLNANYDFRNASRINTLNTNYRLSLAYPRGVFLFRVRPVGIKVVSGNLIRQEGIWSGGSLTGSSQTWMAAQKYNWSGFLKDMNWQYTASFVEEGKSGEELSIYNGALMPQQTVAKNNADNTVIVSNQIYDYLGRPAISTLPSPKETHNGLDFYENELSQGGGGNYYHYQDFDTDAKLKNPNNMSGLGVNNYYANQATSGNGFGVNSKYIADAEGYPFSRTVFMKDGTGRVKQQTSFGGTALGPKDLEASKSVRYFYATPTQEELYRLFGSEVGYADHYKKNLVVDQNGQSHVQYIDMSGRVIATGLSGDAPDNLEYIDTYPSNFDVITADLSVNNELSVDDKMLMSKAFLVPVPNTTFDFEFSLAEIAFSDPCFDNLVFSNYNITIYFEDENYDRVTFDYQGSPVTEIATTVSAFSSTTWSINFLEAGVYTVHKVIELDPITISDLRNNFPSPSSNCFTYTPAPSEPCNSSCEDMCFSGYGFYNENGDKVYTSERGEYIATYVTATSEYVYFDDYTAADLTPITDAIAACQVNCDGGIINRSYDECEVKYRKMLDDMSPGGQYFDNQRLGTFANPVTQNDWLELALGAVTSGSIQFVTGETSWNSIRANWNEVWAEEFVKYHPEFCIYQLACVDLPCVPIDNGDGSALYYVYANKVLDVPFHDKIYHCPSSPSPMTVDAYENIIFNTSNPSIPNQEYLWNPTNKQQQTSPLTPKTYQPFLDGVTTDKLDPEFACRQYEYTENGTTIPLMKNDIEKRLEEYFYDGTSANQMHHSIWYVIDNPDNIHLATSGYDSYVIDYYKNLHGDGTSLGIIGTGVDQLTKYEFFRGAYLYIREYILYQTISKFDGMDAFHCYGGCPGPIGRFQSPNNDGLDANGFQLLFPQNPLFEEFENPNFDAYVDTQTDDFCIDQCTQNANAWMLELNGCNGASTANLGVIKQYFIDICSGSCDGDNPTGADQIDAANGFVTGPWGGMASFEDVINYYNTNNSSNVCAVTPIHPPLEAENLLADCECTQIKDYLTSYYIANNIAVPSVINPLVDIPAANQDNLVSDLEEYLLDTESVTFGQINSWASACASSSAPVNVSNVFMCADFPEFDPTELDAECQADKDATNDYYNRLANNVKIAEAKLTLIKNYINKSWENYDNRETFTMSYDLKEYHYTLFYYDQAGNLVKTIPPNGVIGKTLNAAEIQECKDHLITPTLNPYKHPNYEMITNYKYNSLQQLVEQTTPDGGKTEFWYDELGRLIVSQNARQGSIRNRYSYTVYDGLGRITEAGEIDNGDPFTEVIGKDNSAYFSWHSGISSFQREKVEIRKTYYDEYVNNTATTAEFEQVAPINKLDLRNRIASVTYTYDELSATEDGYDFANHYNYDYVGNVKTTIEENNTLPEAIASISEFRRSDYSYDLVSGNVNQVDYQSGKKDEFHYKYEYDANNRLTVAYSSIAGEIWDKESKNFYYAHGPLARTEIGDKVVQACDYAYTLNGWLKTVNSSVNNSNYDIGADGALANINQNAAVDAHAFSLHYYNNDYKAADQLIGSNAIATISNSAYDGLSPDLYNGNISKMVVSLTKSDNTGVKIAANGYKYDQLQRIKESNTFLGISANAVRDNNMISGSNVNNSNAYKASYSFDGNGNLEQLKRYNGTGILMDDLSYNYYSGANGALNQLKQVTDAAGEVIPGIDLNEQVDPQNYEYDAIGQLRKDASNKITDIRWTVTGKVKSIVFEPEPDPSSTEFIYSSVLEFDYDAMDRRISKTFIKNYSVTPTSVIIPEKTTTYYSFDASGNVLAVYTYLDNQSVPATYTLDESHIYGSKRLGIKTRNINLLASSSYSPPKQRALGTKSYELSDHRGNVMEVISDRKLASATGNNLDFYTAEVLRYSDYYPYGMTQPGRNGSSSAGYRYGFQGQEDDPEIKGEGNSVNYKYRMHDPRVGRFFAVDPLAAQYPYNSTYAFSENIVNHMVEIEGLEADFYGEGDHPLDPHTLFWSAADGATNILYYFEEVFVTDGYEGGSIRSMFNSQGYSVPDGVTDQQLGESFQVRHRNGGHVGGGNKIEVQEGVAEGLFSVVFDVIDIAAVVPGKNGVFMAIRTTGISSKVITNVLRGLQIKSRTNQILKTFVDDMGSGTFSKMEAEGAAILENSFNANLRAITKSDIKSGDFMFTSGKYANKSVDLIQAVKHPNFKMNEFIESIDSHFANKGASTDFFNIDIRALNLDDQKKVLEHVGGMSKVNQSKVIFTGG